MLSATFAARRDGIDTRIRACMSSIVRSGLWSMASLRGNRSTGAGLACSRVWWGARAAFRARSDWASVLGSLFGCRPSRGSGGGLSREDQGSGQGALPLRGDVLAPSCLHPDAGGQARISGRSHARRGVHLSIADGPQAHAISLPRASLRALLVNRRLSRLCSRPGIRAAFSPQGDSGCRVAIRLGTVLSRSATSLLCSLGLGRTHGTDDMSTSLGLRSLRVAALSDCITYNATPMVQGASVADATGGAIIDAEARTAINALISRIEATGLIATV